MKYFSLLFLLLSATTLLSQTTKKVLFMGNSYTGGMPELVADIAKSMGDSLFHMDGSGGQAIKDHATSKQSLAAISQHDWDYVVVQCQSQEAAFNPTYVQQNVFPYAMVLADTINSSGRCTRPIFYMTWGRKNGDAQNCRFYAPLCKYESMQMELRKNYLKMGLDNDAFVSPVGMAWRHTRKNWPQIELYDADESHPSPKGMYLTACTFYAVIFGKSPVGATFKNSITGSEPDSLQKAANFIVFDSLKTWNIHYDTAHTTVSFSASHDTVDFKSFNNNLDSLEWHFGDGSTSKKFNPQHVYSKADTFTVTMHLFKGCQIGDTTFKVITTKYKIPDNVENSQFSDNSFKVFPNPSNGTISIDLKNHSKTEIQFSLISIQGKEVFSTQLENQHNQLELSGLAPGLYYYLIHPLGEPAQHGSLILK